MVMGFDKFREHFAGFEDNYIIIGGSACDWLMDHIAAQPFRATHDIDLVLCAEALLLLKARAWKDFMDRKSRGEFVKDKDLRKHRTDVIRLLATIPANATVEVNPSLLHDFNDFLAEYAHNPTDPAALDLPLTFDDVLARLRNLYVPTPLA